MTVSINLCGSIPENPIVIEAFPSKGYVSSIAAFYLIKELGFELIGSIKVDELDNFVVVHDGQIMRPIRIYVKDNILLIFSEIIILPALIPEFMDKFSTWMGELNPSVVILLASILGIEVEEGHKILGLATNDELKKKLKEAKVEEMVEGVLTGFSSSLSLECNEQKIPAISLTVETQYVPDALAAASLLEVLNSLLSISVNVDKLRETGKQFENRFKSMQEQISKGQKDYQELSDQSMYR